MFYQSCENHSTNYRAKGCGNFSVLLKLVPVIFAFISAAAIAQSSKVDCQCRAPGGTMRDLGYVECVDIVGTQHLVRCVMSTNTPYWKKLEGVDGCPAA
jgi:hypothetical protein